MNPSTTPTAGESWGVFYKSSFSESGNCVEIAYLQPGGVLVRNSRHPDDTVLRFTGDEWRAFVSGMLAGEFPASRVG